MSVEQEELLNDAKYDIIRSFLWFRCGLLTDEQLLNDLGVSHHRISLSISSVDKIKYEEIMEFRAELNKLFRCEGAGTEDVEKLEEYFLEITDKDTISAMEYYYWTSIRDHEKAKELLLGAASRGDFFAERFAKEKGWL